MALASCQKPEIENVQPQEYEYTFLIGNADTKATVGETCVEWEGGDQMGVYTISTSGTSYNRWGNITPGSPAKMVVSSYYALSVGDKVYAYYPYVSSNSQDAANVNLEISAIQDGVDDMPMVSIPFAIPTDLAEKTDKELNAGEIKFANLGSVIEFNVYTETAEYADEVVRSVTFKSDNALAGTFTFDLTKVNYSDESTLSIADLTEKTVVANASDLAVGTKDDPAVVKMVVAPGTYTGSIIVKTDAATYTFPISSAKEFNRSAIKPLGLNLRENVREVDNTSKEVTISFANTDQRTKFSTSEQVWENSGVTFTNAKGSSTSNVADYSNPARFYKNSTVTVEAPGNITQIVFICNTAAYATSLKTSIGESAAVSGQTVTVSVDGETAFTCTLSDGQVRMDELTVTYEELDPTAPSITAENVTGVSARGVEAAELTYEIANLEYSDLTVTCDGTVVTSASKGEDGVINYAVSVNSTTSARDGSITISNGTLTKEVKVSQLTPVFTVSRNDIELGATADSQTTVTVTSDFDWVLSMDGTGYDVTPTSYTWAEGGKKTVTIQATADRTEEGVADLGTITFVNSTTGQELTINVTQATSYVSQESETVTMNIYANKGTLSGKSISWTQNGFIVTNNQAQSSNAIRTSDSDHFRLYANSELIFTSSSKKFDKVVVTCTSGSYATALQTSAKNAGLTATVSGSVVTISTSSPTTAMPTITMSAQSRINKVVVELN